MTKLNYGMIGCGMMGHEHIKNIQLLENTNVKAIFEPDEAMRNTAKSLAPDVVFESSIEALLNRDDLDCLVIVSPNYLHAQQLSQIAKSKHLPLLVEKPVVTNEKDYQIVEALEASYQKPIWVAMEYRYMPPVAKLIEQAQAATGGVKLLSIREHRFPFLEKVGDWNRFNEKTGGTFVEKCCHFFDLMRLITQSEPTRIAASAGQSYNHLEEDYEGKTPDIWDNGYVIVDFKSGTRAMLELCMFAEGARYQEEISAVGHLGKIECFVPGPGRFWPEHLAPAPNPKLVLSPRNPKGPTTSDVLVDEKLLDAGDHNGSTFYQHQKFQQVVLGKQKPEVSLKDGWKAVQMGLAAQQSAATGKMIEL
ncbi:MAG: Gfo/Idh/MocA family protein [Nitratireductor sp.]